MFVISLVQGLLVLHLMTNFNIEQVKMDVQNTIYITLFIQLLFVLILLFYIPVFLQKSFAGIHGILKEISKGIYSIDFEAENLEASLDKEFYTIILTIKFMLKSIKKFDELKKDKIIEHHNRIVSLLNLTNDGFMILDIRGNVVYINDLIIDIFPTINEKVNMIDSKFPPEVENNIKKYAVNVIKKRTKQEPLQFFIPALKRHITLKSAIIRNSSGTPTGAVISFMNLEKKKTEKHDKVEQ